MIRHSVFGLTLCLALSLTTSALADIRVEQGYVRATPPGVTTSAAFMTLHNSDPEPVALTQVQSDTANHTELHQHTEHNGTMQMRQIEAVQIPAQGSTRFQPGSYHIMLMGLQGPLTEGDEVKLMLRFSDGQSTQLILPVKRVQPGQAMPNMGHNHH